MNNIYIIGSPKDLYRTQTFVKTVMDNYKDWNLSVSYFSFTREKKRNLLIIIGNRIISATELLFSFFQICRADYIYCPAMAISDKKTRWQFTFARLLKKRIISEFYISLYDTFVLDRKTAKSNSKEANWYMSIDRKLQECHRVIFLNKTEAERYSRIAGNNYQNLKYKIIPLSIKERNKGNIPYYFNQSKTFNICWWGTYIPLHGLDRIILAMIELQKKEQDFHLYIMGDSDDKAYIFQQLIKENNLEKYVTIRNDYSFRNGLLEPFIIENCDLLMGAFGESEKAKTVILNKCIEAISMKIPVLTQHSRAFKEYFPKDSNSIFYSENSPQSIADSILKIKKTSRQEIVMHINNAFLIYKSNFSIESSIYFYDKLLKELE